MENKKLYFIVDYGFDKEKSITIEGKDVQKAIMAMILKTPVQIGDGVVNGNYIMAIRENWNKALGVNPLWKIDADDWNELYKRGIDKPYKGYISEQKQIVQKLIDKKRLDLIGKVDTLQSFDNLALN